MKTKYGFPIVDADNVFPVVAQLGIARWPKVAPPKDLGEYLSGNLTPTEKEEADRFAPKSEVVFLQDPRGNLFRGFRAVAKNWATVFCLLPGDLVPITVEFKHGSEDICLVPPSGVPSRKDFGTTNPMMECARREFLEETGIELKELIPLSGAEGNAVSPRQSTQRYFPYLGIPKQPIVRQKQSLDRHEDLRVILVPWRDWLQLIKENKIVDECAITVTFRALQELEMLSIT